MTDVIQLKKGEIYYLVGFYDSELKLPSIGTYIYEGLDEEEDRSHLFIDAIGFLNRTGESKEEGGHYVSFPQGKLTGILTETDFLKHLISFLP